MLDILFSKEARYFIQIADELEYKVEDQERSSRGGIHGIRETGNEVGRSHLPRIINAIESRLNAAARLLKFVRHDLRIQTYLLILIPLLLLCFLSPLFPSK